MKKHIRKNVLLSLASILFIVYSCQQQNMLLSYAEELLQVEPDKALRFLEDSIPINKLFQEQYAEWCLLLTEARDKNYVEHTSDSLIQFAVNYYEKHGSPETRMRAYYYMGRVAGDLKQAPDAQLHYLKALEAGENSTNYALLSRICNNLGMLYTYQDAYDMALPCLKHAETYIMQTGDKSNLSFVLRNIARTYDLLEYPDSAIVYYKRTLTCVDSISYPFILNELGNQYAKKEDSRAAYMYVQEALQYDRGEMDFSPVHLVAGKTYLQLGHLDSARYFLEKSMQSPQLTTRAAACYSLYHLAKEMHHWEEYARLQTLYDVLRDSVVAQTYTETMLKMKSLYNYQQAKNEASQARIDKAIVERNSVFWFSIIVIIIGTLAWNFFNIRMKLKRINKAQEEIFQRFSNNQIKETREQIDINSRQIEVLESQVRNNTTAKESLLLEIKLLNLENSRISKKVFEREKMEDNFKISPVYQLFYKKGTRITDEDKESLIRMIDQIYPTFRFRLFEIYPVISHEDLFFCYMLKTGLKNTRIAEILNVSRQAITNKCERLVKDLLGEKNSPKLLVQFIASIM
jgi:tetratricopeptide (TPR) repeat protein